MCAAARTCTILASLHSHALIDRRRASLFYAKRNAAGKHTNALLGLTGSMRKGRQEICIPFPRSYAHTRLTCNAAFAAVGGYPMPLLKALLISHQLARV
jgi:hypothetical protein